MRNTTREAESVSGTPAKLHLSLRGLGRRYRVPVMITDNGETTTVSGSVTFLQSNRGITPFTMLGGALRVRDQIDVDFRVIGRNARARL